MLVNQGRTNFQSLVKLFLTLKITFAKVDKMSFHPGNHYRQTEPFSNERPYFYSQSWTGTSLQWGLVWENIIKKRLISYSQYWTGTSLQWRLVRQYHQIERPFPSSLVPLLQNESKCETFLIKISTACSFIFMQIKVIFIRMVLHLVRLSLKQAQGNLEMAY